MTWAASTHLREILVNMLAVGSADPQDSEEASRLDVQLNHATHELRRYLSWQEGVTLFYPESVTFHQEIEAAARTLGRAWLDSWDGQEFASEHYVNALQDKLIELVHYRQLKGAVR